MKVDDLIACNWRPNIKRREGNWDDMSGLLNQHTVTIPLGVIFV